MDRRRMQEESLRVLFSTLVTLVVVVVAKPVSLSQLGHVSTSGKLSLHGDRPCPVNVDMGEGGCDFACPMPGFSILQSSFDQAHWKARKRKPGTLE